MTRDVFRWVSSILIGMNSHIGGPFLRSYVKYEDGRQTLQIIIPVVLRPLSLFLSDLTMIFETGGPMVLFLVIILRAHIERAQSINILL